MSAPARELAIVFDIQALQNPLHRDRGIGRYVVDHVDALLAAGAPIAALVLNPALAAPPLPPGWASTGLVQPNRPEVMRTARRCADEVVYHVASPFEPAIPEEGVVVPHALRGADVLSVMLLDAIPMRFPEWYQRDATARAFFRRRAALVRTADVVVAISEHTGRDAVELLGVDPARVVVQGSGPASGLTHARAVDVAAADGRPYVLTVSGWGDPRKDLDTTLRAFAALPPAVRARHRLVVVCALPPEGLDQWTAAASAAGLAPGEVHFTGQVHDGELRALYERAAVFVLSSRYEGFGLPALEAAVCGAPVLTSDVSALPEVLDHAPALVPAGDPNALATAMARALTDPGFAADLRAAGARAAARHTWPAVAARTIAAWHTARRSPAHAIPTRLALVGPFPPSKSGVASFNARLVAAMHGAEPAVEIDCFSEGDDPFAVREIVAPARGLPVQAFGRAVHPGSYDAVVFTLGNGHYHRRTLAAVLAHRGIVWLHDARLAGLYLTAAGLFLPGPEPGPPEIAAARAAMRAALTRVYGDGVALPGDDEWWRTEWYDAHGYTFLEEVLDAADTVIVNTTAAATAVRERARRSLPVHVLAHPFPDFADPTAPGADDGEANYGEANYGEARIATLGWTDPVKRPHDLVRAVAIVHRDCAVRLAFVGEVPPRLADELRTLAADAGIADRVELAGFSSAAAYRDQLRRASLVVQLRASTHGEASGALCDAIAAARPVITSIATASDLPPGVVEMVPPDVTVEELAARIDALLADPAHRRQLADRARAHAATWRYADLAAAVVEVVREHGRGPSSGTLAGATVR